MLHNLKTTFHVKFHHHRPECLLHNQPTLPQPFLNLLLFHFRIPGARSSRARRKKATPALFQHQSLALRHNFDATDWPCIPVVGPERVQFWSRAMCSYRTNKSPATAAEDVGMVREDRNRNRISKCISNMQSKCRRWLMCSIRRCNILNVERLGLERLLEHHVP